jgi:molybdopterin-guanine dinucleotide biosynthesis protein B
MFKMVAVVGFKKSGKTIVVESLVRELVRRGHRVGTVKHIREPDFTIDQKGKDTWRHARAGASIVISVAPREVATIDRRAGKLEDVVRRIRGIDFLVIEGFRELKGIPKIVVVRSESDLKKLDDDFTIACIGFSGVRLPALTQNEIKALTKLVEQKALPPLFGLDCHRCGYKTCEDFARAALARKVHAKDCRTVFGNVELRVNGKLVPLNPFVQEFLAGATVGMLSSLKGAKGEEIELRVVRKNVR